MKVIDWNIYIRVPDDEAEAVQNALYDAVEKICCDESGDFGVIEHHCKYEWTMGGQTVDAEQYDAMVDAELEKEDEQSN